MWEEDVYIHSCVFNPAAEAATGEQVSAPELSK